MSFMVAGFPSVVSPLRNLKSRYLKTTILMKVNQKMMSHLVKLLVLFLMMYLTDTIIGI